MLRLRLLGPASTIDLGTSTSYVSNFGDFCFVDRTNGYGFRSLLKVGVRGSRSGFFKTLRTEGVGVRFSRVESSRNILALHTGRGHVSFFRLPELFSFGALVTDWFYSVHRVDL